MRLVFGEDEEDEEDDKEDEDKGEEDGKTCSLLVCPSSLNPVVEAGVVASDELRSEINCDTMARSIGNFRPSLLLTEA